MRCFAMPGLLTPLKGSIIPIVPERRVVKRSESVIRIGTVTRIPRDNEISPF